MSVVRTVFAREFASYFSTPVAYVFLVIYLIMQGMFTFYVGHFYQREQADLVSFFAYQPWLYLFLMPAIAMRLWAEERRSGTFELLLTLPIPLGATVIGKYLAAVAFAGVALLLTAPIWITVNWLGSPDNGVIITGYVGSLLLASAYLAIGAALSATTKNQVVAFILSVAVCFLFLVSGLPMVLDAFSGWAGHQIVLTIANLSFLTHFNNLQKGVVSLADVVYFAAVIALWLWINALVIESKREAG
ncbi:ABC transporter permease subunit [Kordiimonas marina]|uniref:ABC transporter permease subunit n=1 Tax=Kordiimonas marina TaxID=2872312 RepID=UPI001FF55737|nr:ABC transporter permease subunit [Kordiimonas marina]MCJ9430496.1 ABC transporter permease [Kordiimonas marina]